MNSVLSDFEILYDHCFVSQWISPPPHTRIVLVDAQVNRCPEVG